MKKPHISMKENEVSVELQYPSYDIKETVRVGICAVRAADDIVIHFDYKRNGYSIMMDRYEDNFECADVVQELEEVAFIPAWNCG